MIAQGPRFANGGAGAVLTGSSAIGGGERRLAFPVTVYNSPRPKLLDGLCRERLNALEQDRRDRTYFCGRPRTLALEPVQPPVRHSRFDRYVSRRLGGHGHPGHHPGRPARMLWIDGRPDPVSRQPRPAWDRVRERRGGRTDHPAVPHLDDDRSVSFQTRRAKQRDVRARRRDRDPGRGVLGERLRDRRLHFGPGAGRPLRSRPGFRCLRRRSQKVTKIRQQRGAVTSRKRDPRGRQAVVGNRTPGQAGVPVDPSVRSSRALRSSGELPCPFPERPLRRRDCLRRRPGGRTRRHSRPVRPARQHRAHRARRSRRGARRARREHTRVPPPSGHHPRSVDPHDPRHRPTDPGRRSGEHHRPEPAADLVGRSRGLPTRTAAMAGCRSAGGTRHVLRARSTSRRCSRCSSTAGPSCAGCVRASGSSTPGRATSSSTWRPTPGS